MSDYRVAIIVNPALPVGLMANTAATLAAGLGARHPQVFGGKLTDATGLEIDVSSRLPMPVLQADEATLQALLKRSEGANDIKAVVVFPAFARRMHDFDEYGQALPERNLSGETLDGIALCGPKKWVSSLTGALKLLR
ncbi:DUF2000 domain-containing protein [Chimaeribacter arupi]|uniref:DUF2000 domain-containing protein n=1 Tax=Chimaeribacter arupi TaxID=2060066 RepID=A0A2N5EIZ5_9GAMM|nr:DUF2000 domain-containing protein [Chimaeribacter arupi]PLR45208.1 DUF2000 domain-containing protein [Chimaeribacter arupi]